MRTYFRALDEPRSNPPTVDTDWEKGLLDGKKRRRGQKWLPWHRFGSVPTGGGRCCAVACRYKEIGQ